MGLGAREFATAGCAAGLVPLDFGFGASGFFLAATGFDFFDTADFLGATFGCTAFLGFAFVAGRTTARLLAFGVLAFFVVALVLVDFAFAFVFAFAFAMVARGLLSVRSTPRSLGAEIQSHVNVPLPRPFAHRLGVCKPDPPLSLATACSSEANALAMYVPPSLEMP